MKFDRRHFFQSIAAGASASVLSEQVQAVPRLIPHPVPVQYPLMQKFTEQMIRRAELLFYDTIFQDAGNKSAYRYPSFQIPLGQIDDRGKTKSYLDTNMLMSGSFGPHGAVVNRLGFLFHPDMRDDDIDIFSRFGRYEVQIGQKIFYRGLFDWAAAGAERGNPLPHEAKFIDHEPWLIPGYEHFGFEVFLERPHVWKGDLHLLCFLDAWFDWPIQ
jgi:hypothetical protein